MAEEANVTPSENTGSETYQPLTETAPAETKTEATQPEAPAQPSINLTAEQLKYIESNGGIDKVLSWAKQNIGNATQNKTPEQPAQPETPVAQPTPAPQAPSKAPTGYMTPQEVVLSTYFNNLAGQKEYANIAKEIRSGEVFKGMEKLGIRALDANGNINDAQVREYLNLRSASAVATQPADTLSQASAAPTVEYIGLNDGKVTSMDQAIQIMNQSRELEAKGLAGNPNRQAALEYIAKATHADISKLKK